MFNNKKLIKLDYSNFVPKIRESSRTTFEQLLFLCLSVEYFEYVLLRFETIDWNFLWKAFQSFGKAHKATVNTINVFCKLMSRPWH